MKIASRIMPAVENAMKTKPAISRYALGLVGLVGLTAAVPGAFDGGQRGGAIGYGCAHRTLQGRVSDDVKDFAALTTMVSVGAIGFVSGAVAGPFAVAAVGCASIYDQVVEKSDKS